MFKSNEVFSDHCIFKNGDIVGWVDVTSLMFTLRALNKIEYQKSYIIKDTTLKNDDFKKATLEYYEKHGICDRPIVVTTKNFCLDGRHRVHASRLKGKLHIKAYIVPHNLIETFYKEITQVVNRRSINR
tara:strand:+ start:431 stop:817 length:387 start_codon:yes stop_codon:yes gene_type:complete